MSRARTSQTIGALRVAGACVLAVFLLGTAAGPLRPCLSHPGHIPESHDSVLDAVSHNGVHPRHHDREADHVGCNCLGQCSLEQVAFFLPSTGLAVVESPEVRAVVAHAARTDAERPARSLPLARPPPPVA